MSDETEAETADESTDEQSGFQEGDFVKLAYTARTVDDGELVDTTDEEVAEEEDVDTEERDFSPRTIVIGEEHIFEDVENDLIGKEVGDEGTVLVESAFGEYEEDEVRTISVEKIPEDDRYPGAHVDIEGEHGHVETVIGGRARVDFNHPLAGEDVEYEYEIVGEVEDTLEKAQGMLQMYFEAELDMELETEEVEEEVETEDGETETETVEQTSLIIEQSQELQFNQQWMMGKGQILNQLIDMLDIDRVVVQETFEGQPQGMPGMMGGMGGGMGGEDLGDVEDALEDADVDAEEIVEELDEE
jgi:FKBP-type peptidyl-prolyl cis-trans isomerase SlyD